MTQAIAATPRVDVWLRKTISRDSIDGNLAVSSRYERKDKYIDLTPFLNVGSAVRTSKSVKQPAGAFNITFADKPQRAWNDDELESVYGLIEPQDVIEIRMWGGLGVKPDPLPIVMRGFVTSVNRSRSMGENGQPMRTVTISGQDYGKVWQMFQVLYLAAYAEKQALLTNFGLWELFGIQVTNSMPASEFIRTMVERIINPFLAGFLPADGSIPTQIIADDLSVAHGMVNNSYQQAQGPLYEIMRFHGDVGTWNELYTEDREDGVHCVYRPVPALKLTTAVVSTETIQDDAPAPIFATIPDSQIKSINEGRSDANVANFYWVNNVKFDLIDDMQRRLASLRLDDGTVSIKDYPNSGAAFYGVRPMFVETQQGDDAVFNMLSMCLKDEHEARGELMKAWIDKRRQLLIEMNKDNVIYESGTMVVKGGPTRDGTKELMRAGDYAIIQNGQIKSMAYVHQIDHEFMPFQSYTTTLTYSRGEGFINRASLDGSPWLSEQARFDGAAA
jgi:uncharacterized protein YhfF